MMRNIMAKLNDSSERFSRAFGGQRSEPGLVLWVKGTQQRFPTFVISGTHTLITKILQHTEK